MKSGLLSPATQISSAVLPACILSRLPDKRLAFSIRNSTCSKILPPNRHMDSARRQTLNPVQNRGQEEDVGTYNALEVADSGDFTYHHAALVARYGIACVDKGMEGS